MATVNFDLQKFRGQKSSIFTGRPQGRTAREELDLDKYDKESGTEVVLVIPNGTTSFNPSFYLGLLYSSYKTLGLDGFISKYHFDIQIVDPETKAIIEKNLEDGQRNAINALNNRTGLWSIFI